MRGDPNRQTGVLGCTDALLQQRRGFAEREDELVVASGRNVHAPEEAIGELLLEIEGFGGGIVRGEDGAQHARGTCEIEFMVGDGKLGDELPGIGGFLGQMMAPAPARVCTIRRGVPQAEALEILAGTLELREREHRSVAHVGGVVCGQCEAVLRSGEREPILSGDERARGKGRKPADEPALAEVAHVFLAIGIASLALVPAYRLFHLGAMLEEVRDVFVVRGGGERREHALRVPVLRIELAGFTQLRFRGDGETIRLGIVGDEGQAVVDGLGCQSHEMGRSIGVACDELRRIAVVVLHAPGDEGSILERVDVFAVQCSEDEPQAVFLDGIVRHMLLLSCCMGSRGPPGWRCMNGLA